jgi:hypothetical protein
MDLGEVKKNPWKVTFQDPEGGSNMTDVDVEEVNGRYVLKGKLIDKTKPGKILVIIDPPSYYLLGGFDEFLIVSPDGDPAAWGDLDCDGDADSADSLLVPAFGLAGLTDLAPNDGCPTSATTSTSTASNVPGATPTAPARSTSTTPSSPCSPTSTSISSTSTSSARRSSRRSP